MSARRSGLAPRRLAVAIVVLGGLTTATACGTQAPDLFAVQRTGSVPGARLTLIVSDSGLVRCNGGSERQLPDPQLLAARQLQRDLDKPAKRGVSLAPGRTSVFTYTVTTPSGSVRFSDTSTGIEPPFQRLAAFTHAVAQGVCGLPR